MLPDRWQLGRPQLRLAVDRARARRRVGGGGVAPFLGLLVIVWFVLKFGGVGVVEEP